MPTATIEPTSLPETETEVAAEAAREFRAELADGGRPVVLRTTSGQEIAIPESAFRLFITILAHLATGDGIVVMPEHAELSTQQAADLLNVSRPFLVGLIKDGELPARKVGTHRRILLSDLLAYKHRDDARREEVLQRLVEDTQALGGYE